MTDDPTSGRALSVLHVVTLVGSGGEFGGPVSVAESQARELTRRGHTVVVTSLQRGPVQVPDGLAAEQWRTFPARQVVPGAGMLGLSSARFLRHLWAAVRRADVVHVHAGRDLVSLSALSMAWLRGVPVVSQTHGMVLPRGHLRARLFDPVFLRLLRRSAAVLYMTADEHTDLVRLLGPATSLEFLGNGVDLPEPSPTPAGSPPRVVFLARLHPVKRVGAFAEMAALLRARGITADYLVYGPDQGDLTRLRRLIAERSLEGVVTYGGSLDHASAVAELSRATAYVLPSSADWMPMALIEALAAGVPSVCTDACGLADLLRETRSALVTDGSPESLASAVERLLLDPVERTRLSRAARAVAASHFSVAAVVDDLVMLYRHTAAREPVDGL